MVIMMMESVSSHHISLLTGATVGGLLAAVLLYRLSQKSANGLPKLYHKDTAFARHILKYCPKLKAPFLPPLWARSSHFQTLVPSLLRTPGVTFSREILTMLDGGTVAVDWVVDQGSPGHSAANDSNSPILFIIPGLTGDAEGMRHLCKRGLVNGYRPVVFNKRGHGGSSLTTPKMQSFGDSSDVREVLEYLRNKFVGCRLVAIGVSAGSALLVAYLRDHQQDPITDAAVCISAGYDSETLFANGFAQPYEWLLLRSLKRLVSKHQDILSKVVDMMYVMKSKTLNEFEDRFYRQMYGYADLKAYWAVNNPMHGVEEVEVPILCINSLDDQLCQKYLIPFTMFKKHSTAMLAATDYGGHCGFLEIPKMESWADQASLEYLNAVLIFLDDTVVES